jgi:hypothetical protein
MDLPDVPTLARELTQTLAPLLPYLAQKAGDTEAEEGMKKVARTFWEKLWGKTADRPAAREAMEDAAADPEDVENRAALSRQLRKLLAADEELREEAAVPIGRIRWTTNR